MNHHLDSTDNLFDYFHRKVGEARATSEVALSSDTELYIAQLLTERARADHPRPPETTLAELHGRAAHAAPHEQVQAYRELGDRSLYLLGCFRESLEGRAVGPRYYREMGAAAYWRVDSAVKRWFADAFGPVFHELALRFEDCVGLLNDVRDRHDDSHPDTLIRLYQAWRATGSADLARRLAAHGVLVGAES